MRNNGAPFVPFTLPLTPVAALRLFVDQLAFEAEIDRELAEDAAGLLVTATSPTRARAVLVAASELGAGAINALNAVEV